MSQVNLDDLQKDLPAYLRRVEAGESFVILRSGKPVAEVKPVNVTGEALRPFGLCAGEFTVPDDFDSPLPDQVLDAFEGK